MSARTTNWTKFNIFCSESDFKNHNLLTIKKFLEIIMKN